MHYYGRVIEQAKETAPRPGKGAAWYKVPGEEEYYLIDREGNIKDLPPAPSVSAPIELDVTVAAARVLTLNSNPLVVIPAPAPNQFIQIIKASVFIDFKTTPYTTNTTLALVSAGVAPGVLSQFSPQALEATESGIEHFIQNASPAGEVTDKNGVTISLITVGGNPANGDSNLKIKGLYRIVTI